ncbi:MAG TPA: CFI-box-CTERM domain-containing protein [Candidatus Angelobacter sp.]
MGLFLLNDSDASGTGGVFPMSAFADLVQISNMDGGIGQDPPVGDLIHITYTQSQTGTCPNRLNTLVNTTFPAIPADPVDIVILALDNSFVASNGTLLGAFGGETLNPGQTDSNGFTNPTNSALVLYDTSQGGGAGYCLKGAVSGNYDLQTPNPVILYHELSHAFRICTASSLSLAASGCTASPEEAAAEVDENDMRTQLGIPLRDTTDHCGQACSGGAGPNTGSCCIVATIATGSPYSPEVNALRQVRDSFLRRSEVGYSFFEHLHHDYYGFSPEVRRMMAVTPELKKLIETWFVRPLTASLGLIRAWSLDGCDENEIGKRFEQGAAETNLSPEIAALVRDMLQGRSEVPAFNSDLIELAALLQQRAQPSPYIEWGLIQTTCMYLDACVWRSEGLSPSALGERLTAAFDAWASAMPLTDAWHKLPRYSLNEELAFLHRALLRTQESRLRFGQRLAIHISADDATLKLMAEAGFLPLERKP